MMLQHFNICFVSLFGTNKSLDILECCTQKQMKKRIIPFQLADTQVLNDKEVCCIFSIYFICYNLPHIINYNYKNITFFTFLMHTLFLKREID